MDDHIDFEMVRTDRRTGSLPRGAVIGKIMSLGTGQWMASTLAAMSAAEFHTALAAEIEQSPMLGDALADEIGPPDPEAGWINDPASHPQ